MKYIDTYIVEKFDVSNLHINTPKFYTNIKNETKLSYLLLSYMYYKNYDTYLDINKIGKDENKKPIFIDNSLYFNISHSKTYVACSISTGNIGIDIEEDRLIKDNILDKILHKNDKDNRYINIWNIKEAYSKYLGIGLKLKFSEISIDEIKKNVNLVNKIYSIQNNNIYFSLCYNIKESIIKNNINFINKERLIKFYQLT